jgi:hypothetical protein
MKEKIWIEKLIELLNEYTKKEKFWIIWKFWEDPIWVYWYVNDKYWLWWASKLVSVSKEYWFIKWLVENDKIDIVKVYENLTNYEIEIRIRAVKELLENNEEDTISYLKLLMLLAIQDEPVKYLCEILR